ncbi:MAG: DUF4292 domain-containing protein, partial [Calditrichaeota bacterium]
MRCNTIRFSAILLIMVLGCSSTALRQKPSFVEASLEQWPEYYSKNRDNILTMKSEAVITLESPAIAGNFTAEMLYGAPDTLFLKAEGPLGIDLGKTFIGRKRFILYNQFNNTFFSGSLNDKYYSTFLETDVALNDIKETIIGYPPLPGNIRLIDEKHGIFMTGTDVGKKRYVVNTKNWQLESIEIFKNDRMVIKQEFERYTSEQGIPIPRLIRIILPHKKEMVAIY